jgi:hypothetical protein
MAKWSGWWELVAGAFGQKIAERELQPSTAA